VDTVQSCVASLVNSTDFVVADGDEEYLPPSLRESEESEFQFTRGELEKGIREMGDGDEYTSTSDTASDRSKATDD